ncbi:hypothetical protein [Pseudonocardia aurantiaca]|uniref:Uncharacterized protein n=1 Tax=Pseudonocardia aurantiaca TaxID=75290 RepID=A0ABW4FS20_9PSEU
MTPPGQDPDVEAAVSCRMCGWAIPEPDQWRHDPQVQSEPCPDCGSISWLVDLHGSDHAQLHEFIGLRGKAPGVKRPRFELQAGDQLSVASGRWVRKRRLIDRDGDWYEETVVDPSTGETVHETREPLSEHWGHGSAKSVAQRGDDELSGGLAARGPEAGAREPSPPAPPEAAP